VEPRAEGFQGQVLNGGVSDGYVHFARGRDPHKTQIRYLFGLV
jgi:hypothetical protein